MDLNLLFHGLLIKLIRFISLMIKRKNILSKYLYFFKYLRDRHHQRMRQQGKIPPSASSDNDIDLSKEDPKFIKNTVRNL